MRILAVCTGNVCRSPVAERLLQGVLPGVAVASAGTSAPAGAPLDPLAAAELVRLGGDPAGHAARGLTEPMLAEVDLVLTATRDHRRQVVSLSPRHLHRTFTLLELAAIDARDLSDADLKARLRELSKRRARVADDELDLPDPLDRDAAVHRAVADQIAGAVGRIAPVVGELGR